MTSTVEPHAFFARDERTEGRKDGRKNGWVNASDRVACPQLKIQLMALRRCVCKSGIFDVSKTHNKQIEKYHFFAIF